MVHASNLEGTLALTTLPRCTPAPQATNLSAECWAQEKESGPARKERIAATPREMRIDEETQANPSKVQGLFMQGDLESASTARQGAARRQKEAILLDVL